MKHFLSALYLLTYLLCVLAQCTAPASEFHMEGDYLLGGLFDIHHVSASVYHERPETTLSNKFSTSSSQMMRYSVEQINNSTRLLPNISLGYQIFDHCSDTQNFPGPLNLISNNGLIPRWGKPLMNQSKVIAVIGTYTSTESLSIAPLFMGNLIPMVSYAASSSIFSKKQNFPSFLRTVLPSKDVMKVIVDILLNFNWRWVAFLYSDNDYGKDGLDLFIQKIKDTEICLAYNEGLDYNTDFSPIFKQIDAQRIKVIIVIAPEWNAEALIKSAIQKNFTNKVWIAGNAWSLNKRLPKEKGIRNIGTVLGVSEPAMTIPGFSDFIYSSKKQTYCENAGKQKLCNQVCNCSSLTPQEILAADPSFSFPVYSAVYATSHALHHVLQCGTGRCNMNITVHPYMILAELRKSNFTLLNQRIRFDENGDPMFGSYSIVYWNYTGDAQEVGITKFYPSPYFFINTSKIYWHGTGKVPISLCSRECPRGYAKTQDGIHKCCFTCEICPNGTYVNITEDPYTCIYCKETEWSEGGSTSCKLRVVEYIAFTDIGAILLMIGSCAFMGLTLAMSVLFAINYNTPVVRSAGGPMCFLILGCLTLCSVGVFFYFGKPTTSFCIMRLLPFTLFYTVCLACFVVRSFQIVCIFKIAANFPQLHSLWIKYHGQWWIIAGAFVMQTLLLLIGYCYGPPVPYDDKVWYQDKIIADCDINLKATAGPLIFLASLCSLCFIFSYMGKDLPKNYNEAKAITFCLFILILTWIIFVTVHMLYHGKLIIIFNALAVLSSLYSFLLWYFLPKCYIIIFQPYKNTQQYFQGLIQNYTKTISQ
uniref:G-protein coupled receptors family 3 profile domain-containing protein n=1 Tax=Anabas testudineus TaxID=64144 RepID=A0A7N6FL63_ANATE